MMTASMAGTSGDAARVESFRSRSASSFATTQGLRPDTSGSLERRAARTSGRAVR